jgi:hypothetical protein
MVRHLGGGFEIDLGGLLDERVNDVRLPARIELRADDCVDFIATRLRLCQRFDRQPSGGRVPNHRHVQIAVHRERERPRDRRGGHHQHVRMQPFGPQRRPLHDAEAVLLVDHDEPELLEADVTLYQRVRADDQVNAAGFDFRELLATRGRRRRSGQERDTKAGVLQEPRDVREMLVGEDFGRRHERHLKAVFHFDQRREEGDDGLPGADVALQQPVHRMRPLQVVDDFLQRLLLTGGQLERQHAAGRLPNPIVHAHGAGLRLGRGKAAPGDDPHLKEEGFFEDQPPLRRRREPIQLVERRIVWRKVCRQQGGVSGRQAEAQAQVVRQRLGQVGRQALQRVVHQPALHLARDRPAPLIHRDDAAGVDGLGVLLVEDFVLRVGQLQAAVSPHLERAVQHDVLPRFEHVAQVRLVEPGRTDGAACVADERLENLEAGTPGRSQAAAQDPAAD